MHKNYLFHTLDNNITLDLSKTFPHERILNSLILVNEGEVILINSQVPLILVNKEDMELSIGKALSALVNEGASEMN